jgi:hypothetical protein
MTQFILAHISDICDENELCLGENELCLDTDLFKGKNITGLMCARHSSCVMFASRMCRNHAYERVTSHTWVRTPNLKSFVCTYEWVIFYMNESRLTWMSHVSHEWVTSHMYESCLTCMKFASIRHICAHMKESCLTCVIFEVTYVHTWISQVSHVSYLKPHMCTHELVRSRMCHIWSHTCAHMNESRLTCMTPTSIHAGICLQPCKNVLSCFF